MLHNMETSDAPIIVAAHTNHAVDQLLRHVSKFEPDFIRMGAMTTDLDIIKPRTLYEIKKSVKPSKLAGGLRSLASNTLKRLTSEMIEILSPLIDGKEVFSAALLRESSVISEVQYTSLIDGAQEWCEFDVDISTSEVALWLGDEKVEVKRQFAPDEFGLDVEYEEVDLEFEQLKEAESERRQTDDDDDLETLRGKRATLMEPWSGRKRPGVSEQSVLKEYKKTDMWDIATDVSLPFHHVRRSKLML